MDQEKNNNNQDELKELLQQNLELNQEMYEMVKALRNNMRWARAWGIFKFVIIFVPLILGSLYLAPIAKSMIENFQNVLSMDSYSALQTIGQTKSGELLDSAISSPDQGKILEEWKKILDTKK